MSDNIPTPLVPLWKVVRGLRCECDAPAGTSRQQAISAAASESARWAIIPDRSAP